MNSKCSFSYDDSCHFPQDPKSKQRQTAHLHNMTEKSIRFWHKQCSAFIVGKCGHDVLPGLQQILLLFTLSLALICSLRSFCSLWHDHDVVAKEYHFIVEYLRQYEAFQCKLGLCKRLLLKLIWIPCLKKKCYEEKFQSP